MTAEPHRLAETPGPGRAGILQGREMRVCGIDPGLQCTGYAVVEATQRLRVVDAGVIRSDGSADLGVRLQQIFTDLCALFDETRPQVLAVENIYTHYRHPQTAVLMGHARGVVLLAGSTRGLAVRSLPATHIKRSLTGNGRASKPQMQQAVQRQLGLQSCPQPHDVADALAIALCEVLRRQSLRPEIAGAVGR